MCGKSHIGFSVGEVMENKNILEQLRNMRCSAPREGANIRAYLYETLPLEEVEAFEKHLDDCERCSKIIFLEEYLQGEEIELLTCPELTADNHSNGRAIAASH
jgi:hypothetical protein